MSTFKLNQLFSIRRLCTLYKEGTYLSIYIERERDAVIISQGESAHKKKIENRKWSDSFFVFFLFFSLVDKSMTVESKKLLAILFFFYAAVYLSVYLYIFSLSHS